MQRGKQVSCYLPLGPLIFQFLGVSQEVHPLRHARQEANKNHWNSASLFKDLVIVQLALENLIRVSLLFILDPRKSRHLWFLPHSLLPSRAKPMFT